MNIIEILWKLGYDVLESNSTDKRYTITYSSERKRRMWKQIKEGTLAVENELLNDVFHITVGEVGFNPTGDLCVEFVDVNTKEIIEIFEYRNMKESELY
ncbi:hypothetical protein [Clostridium butyricum]|uniref:hypothetical protein n=1 Tax=Clostridium butyricum TaxID=1492 RepID=UPI002AAFD19D|nr:hypothetical protein [Clostridium butyricum]